MTTSKAKNQSFYSDPGWLESQVLGGLLSEDLDIELVAPVLKAEDFYSDKNRLAFQSMLELRSKNIPIMLPTMNNQIEKNGTTIQIGGASYLTYCTELYIPGQNFEYYVQEIKRESEKRKLKIQAERLIHAINLDDEEGIEKIGAHIFGSDTASDKVHSYPSQMPEAAYFGLAGDIVKAISPHTEADPVALLLTGIVFFGNCVGSRPHIKVGADKHTPRIYATMVGETSKARKGSSLSPIKEIYKETDAEWVTTKIQGGLSSGEGLSFAVRDEIFEERPVKEKGRVIEYENVKIDEGVKDKRLLIIEEELARVLKAMNREGNVLSPIIRQAWDSGNLQVITKNSPIKATGAHISIIAHTTSEELLRYLNNSEFSNGFCNRFVYVGVGRSKLLPFGGNFDILSLGPLLDRLKKAIEYSKNLEEVTWAAETRPYWESIYPELSAAKPGIVGSLLARSEAQVIRLALIYTLMDCKKQIEICHLKAALAVWGYAEDSVRYIFQSITGDSIAERVLAALNNNPEGLTRTQINHVLGKHHSSNRINQALDTLKASNLATSERKDTAGRPVERWSTTNSSAKKEKKAK